MNGQEANQVSRVSRLVFGGSSFEELRSCLLQASPIETAAFVLARSTRLTDGTWRLVAFETISVDEDEYLHRTPSSAQVAPEAVARVVVMARKEDASLFLAHSHPMQEGPLPSEVDLVGEQTLLPALQRRVPEVPHGRIIVGTEGTHAMLFTPDGKRSDLKLVQSGMRVTIFTGSQETNPDTSVYDRQVRAFGRAGQSLLSQLRIGIVGLGGTGSHVAQQLAHLGINDFIVIDNDKVDPTSLNRVVGAATSDVGSPKVQVARDQILRVNNEAAVEAHEEDILRSATALRLLDTDFVFTCTDSHGTRAVLNQLCYQYAIPMIDAGLAIRSVDGAVSHISGRVQMISPGLPCLACAEALDPEEVRRDLLSEAERAADPYIVGAAIPQPAVVSINGTAASLAVTMFLSAVTGLPNGERYQALRLEVGSVSSVVATQKARCPICSTAGALYKASSWSPPGRRT